MDGQTLTPDFFDRDPQIVACDLIGKVLCHHVEGRWLQAAIVETEAYYLWDKASHASLGYTEKRKALFMPPGTIYMYYARGGDSFNVSCRGEGNAVLIKAARPHLRDPQADEMIALMQRLNPLPSGKTRSVKRLCSGQTLLCRALGLKVPAWSGHTFDDSRLRIVEAGLHPRAVVRTTRLGIPHGRDGHLLFRFVDLDHVSHSTRNPLSRGTLEGRDYTILHLPPRTGPGAQPPDWDALLGLTGPGVCAPPSRSGGPDGQDG